MPTCAQSQFDFVVEDVPDIQHPADQAGERNKLTGDLQDYTWLQLVWCASTETSKDSYQIIITLGGR